MVTKPFLLSKTSNEQISYNTNSEANFSVLGWRVLYPTLLRTSNQSAQLTILARSIPPTCLTVRSRRYSRKRSEEIKKKILPQQIQIFKVIILKQLSYHPQVN